MHETLIRFLILAAIVPLSLAPPTSRADAEAEAVSITVRPGTHFFLAGNVGTSLLKAEVEAGKRYYAWLDYGKMVGRVRLTPVPLSESKDLQKWLKKTKQVELNPQAVTNRIRDREKIVTDFLRLAIEQANNGTADFTLLDNDNAY